VTGPETVGGSNEDRVAGPIENPPSRRLMVAYRVMALTTAVLLIILVFVGIPLQVAAGRPQVVNVVGTTHGFLYIVYLVVAFALTWRLRVPKGRMLLVLLAGTVPFCGFVAERKMTRRFEVATGASSGSAGVRGEQTPGPKGGNELRQRWLSPRAFVLHAEVLVVVPACVLAGWWQATQALGGNELSWVYSVEWPIFALLAAWGWWHLVHEDAEAFRARRWRTAGEDVAGRTSPDPGAPAPAPEPTVRVEAETTQWAAALAIAVWLEFALGWLTLVLVPFGRPSGWLPSRGVDAYGVHASLGVVVALGAIALLVRTRRLGRIARIVGWTGGVSIAVAGIGGLMTAGASLERVLGVMLMFAGAALAGAAYLVPVVLHRQARRAGPGAIPELAGSVVPDAAAAAGPDIV
jgi:integral membrane protein